MPMYNYNCSSCGIIFEELVSGEFYAHGIGLKEHTRTGSRANVEHAWMEGEIQNSKDAIKGETGINPYSNYTINHDEAVKQGLAKKVNPRAAKQRKESSAKLTQDASKGMSDYDLKRSQDGLNSKLS